MSYATAMTTVRHHEPECVCEIDPDTALVFGCLTHGVVTHAWFEALSKAAKIEFIEDRGIEYRRWSAIKELRAIIRPLPTPGGASVDW